MRASDLATFRISPSEDSSSRPQNHTNTAIMRLQHIAAEGTWNGSFKPALNEMICILSLVESAWWHFCLMDNSRTNCKQQYLINEIVCLKEYFNFLCYCCCCLLVLNQARVTIKTSVIFHEVNKFTWTQVVEQTAKGWLKGNVPLKSLLCQWSIIWSHAIFYGSSGWLPSN